MALNLHEQQALRLSNPSSATTENALNHILEAGILSAKPASSKFDLSCRITVGTYEEKKKKKEEQYSFRFSIKSTANRWMWKLQQTTPESYQRTYMTRP